MVHTWNDHLAIQQFVEDEPFIDLPNKDGDLLVRCLKYPEIIHGEGANQQKCELSAWAKEGEHLTIWGRSSKSMNDVNRFEGNI